MSTERSEKEHIRDVKEAQSLSIEIERKFKIGKLPEDLSQYPHEDIIQVYTEILEDGAEIRFRKNGNKYLKTIKRGKGMMRDEEEIFVDESQFHGACESAIGQRIEKTRYSIVSGQVKFELDIFHGNLTGLETVEVEFSSEEESKLFQPPEWLGEEVTENSQFKNQSLAINGLPKDS